MILLDVNVLLAAHRAEHPHHEIAGRLVHEVAQAPAPFGVSELVLSAFVRIATNPRAFARRPSTLDEALAACTALTARPTARRMRPGERHWSIFTGLCRTGEARGNLVADAYHGALAIEHGCEWVTFDRDFARFPGLRWRSPLD